MLCVKFEWNCSSGSEEGKSLMHCACTCSISPSYPYKEMTLNLNKLKFQTPKNALCQVWLKMVLEKKLKSEKFTDIRMDRQTTNKKWSAQVSLNGLKANLPLAQFKILKNHTAAIDSYIFKMLRKICRE